MGQNLPTNDLVQTWHQYIIAKLMIHFQRARFLMFTIDWHYSLDSEDYFCLGCQNVSHQQQFFSKLTSPGQ